jgi:uncharacterized protein (DUF486 family)
MDLYIRDAIFRRDNDSILLSTRGQEGLVISVVFTALATCFVVMRMYTRMKLMNRVEANDWMVIIALVSWVIGVEEYQILMQMYRSIHMSSWASTLSKLSVAWECI